MKRMVLALLFFVAACVACHAQMLGLGADDALYRKPAGVVSRWYSFENLEAAKGGGGKENHGAKGHAFDMIAPGETKVLMDAKGSGTVRRMWFTLKPLAPRVLRSLRLEMYWDGKDKPAVSVPMGDFFNWVLGRPVAFENALFANPEARSFVCFIPMPFRTSAKVTLTNDSDVPVTRLFYDINITLGDEHGDDVLYFHSSWRRERPTKLGEDFAILPLVKGSGRFLGCHIGVIADDQYIGWWGEGEVKVYIDGDKELPTLCGTGTEDYIATAWGQGEYAQRYHGCLIANNEEHVYSFYRYHIPDPIYFDQDCRVTIQQIGGSRKLNIVKMLEAGVRITPITILDGDKFVKLLEQTPPVDLSKEFPNRGWTNYYRQDDYSAVAFFYLDAPENNLPPLASVDERVEAIENVPPPQR